ncbi:imidazole glycerol phosphate synthase subunit HisH [Parvularcula lutaonensis]|uniref:Imidazole glycerol phosphate synthase subunit HisH n=1 Tax=Parvularcula lutaonensis TaxID=491923 RepID=A0ABV7MEF2_9PROT|nr:imidazole glycerol phosphate synthase subunit HisH [Parvularcula lutaonensis]GGY51699.1 imidazole glycerol phosphate synthase subunit HisH [Parvularcula lutaonensis]
MPVVCLIDYGAGNLHSAKRGLERAAPSPDWRVEVSADPETLLAADRLVLPGVGAFASCAAGLRARDGVEQAIHEAVSKQAKPFLGICVGMQLLADRGLEHQITEGLGLIAGTVRALDAKGLRVPHMGWNDVRARKEHPVLPADSDAYFVHSYVFECEDEDAVIATCDYGETFPAAVAKDTVIGAQFHPEKSGAYGLSFLKNFLEWRP